MAIHKWRDIRAKNRTPEQIARVDERVQRELMEMDLREVRDLVGITQVELAEKIDVNQATVSKLERDPTMVRMSTMKRVIEALGGELEVIAVIKGKRIRLGPPANDRSTPAPSRRSTRSA